MERHRLGLLKKRVDDQIELAIAHAKDVMGMSFDEIDSATNVGLDQLKPLGEEFDHKCLARDEWKINRRILMEKKHREERVAKVLPEDFDAEL